MKLVYLELEEEITSVIDKLRRTPTAEVFLVVPKKANLAQSLVNLKLLKKHAGMLGKDVTIVTADPVGLNLAQRAGLPARPRVDAQPAAGGDEEINLEPETGKKSLRVRSYREIQQVPAKKKKEELGRVSVRGEPKKPKAVSLVSRRKIALVLILVLAGLVGAAIYVYFFLPTGQLKLTLKTEAISNDAKITVSETVGSPDAGTNQIPGKKYQVEEEGSVTAATTGEKDVGRKAQGTITLYNTYQTTPRTIVPSRFQAADGKIFVSQEAVTLPGYTDTGGGNKTPGTVTVPVEAEEPGDSYNIGPTSFVLPALDPGLKKDIYGKSSTAMVGGKTEMAKVVSEEDLKKAEETIVNRLKEKAVANFQDADYSIIPAGSNVEILSYEPKPAKDEKAVEFSLKIKAKLTFLAFREAELKSVSADDLKNVLPPDKFVLGDETSDASFELSEDRITEGAMVIYYHEDKRFTPLIDKEKIKLEVAGLSADEAKAKLQGRDNIMAVDVDFWPFWVARFPADSQRVTVDIELR